MVAHNATEAMFVAEQLGLPVDMHLESPELTDAFDDKRVRRQLGSITEVRSALHDLVELQHQSASGQRIHGVTLAPHRERPNARQFLLEVFRDPVFGPVIRLGAGGSQGEAVRDQAFALPPLNRFLAGNLIDATRIRRTLEASAKHPAADRSALEDALLGISNLVCEMPALERLHI